MAWSELLTIARMFGRTDEAMLVPGQSQLDSLTQEVVGVSSVSLQTSCSHSLMSE